MSRLRLPAALLALAALALPAAARAQSAPRLEVGLTYGSSSAHDNDAVHDRYASAGAFVRAFFVPLPVGTLGLAASGERVLANSTYRLDSFTLGPAFRFAPVRGLEVGLAAQGGSYHSGPDGTADWFGTGALDLSVGTRFGAFGVAATGRHGWVFGVPGRYACPAMGEDCAPAPDQTDDYTRIGLEVSVALGR
ncbi:MAG TPA: hypothetical protein VHG91_18410 [Longimicrobium sp.]|nr:hypothetical protein [Longimicrobium sp.]